MEETKSSLVKDAFLRTLVDWMDSLLFGFLMGIGFSIAVKLVFNI